MTHDWLSGPVPKLKPTYAAITHKHVAKEKRIGDPTQLILVDEADRLKMVSLEQMRRSSTQEALGQASICGLSDVFGTIGSNRFGATRHIAKNW